MDMVRFLLSRKNIIVNDTNGRGESPLSIAVSRGDLHMARILLAHEYVGISAGRTGCDHLTNAMARSDWAMAHLLLQHGADIEESGYGRATPLMVAVSGVITTAVRILLRCSQPCEIPYAARPHYCDRRSEVLTVAIHQGNKDIAKLLLEHYDASQFSTAEATKLWITANSIGHDRIADLLLEHTAPVNLDTDEGCEALMQAVKDNQVHAVDQLLKHGANVNRVRKESPPTPLCQAICSRNVEMARKLIAMGADINYLRHYDDYSSPLCYAASRGNLEIFGLLMNDERIDLRAEFRFDGIASNCKVMFGQTTIGGLALQISAWYGHDEVFGRLWEHQDLEVDVNQNFYGPSYLNKPLLWIAASNGSLFIAKKIVAGARGEVDLNRTNLDGDDTPLKQAVRQRDTLFVQWILEVGNNKIDLEFGECQEDGTALWCAVNMGSYEIAEMLLTRSANPNVEGFPFSSDTSPAYTATPLWRAAYSGDKRMVELLLSKGADVSMKGRVKWQSWGNTPLSFPHSPLVQAAHLGHTDIVRLLLEYGAKTTNVDEIDDAVFRSRLERCIQRAMEDGLS